MKRQISKLFIFGIVFLLLAGACAAPAPPTLTPTPGPLDLVKVFQDTLNKRDTEGFLALFADKPNWDSLGDWEFSALSLKAVRNVAEAAFEMNVQIELSNCQLENDLVSCETVIKDDCTPPEPFVYHADMKFRFKDNKISYVACQADSNDSVAFGTYFIQMATWAKQNLPTDYATYANGVEETKLSYTGDQGEGKLSASELGQVFHRMCTGYAKAKK